MLNELKVAPLRLRASLRTRVARVLVAILVGTLIVPVGSVTTPSLINQASASYTINCSGGGSFTVAGTIITTNSGPACKGIVTVPEGITEIEPYAFNTGTYGTSVANPDITEILLPSSLLLINNSGLQKLTGLTRLTIPGGVVIREQSLLESTSLTELIINGGTDALPTRTAYTIDHGVNRNKSSNFLPQRLVLGSGRINLRQDALENNGPTEVVFGSGTYYVGTGNFRSQALAAIDFGTSTSPQITIAKQNVTTAAQNPYGFAEDKLDPFQGSKIRSVRNCSSDPNSAFNNRLKELTNDLGQTLFSLSTCNTTAPVIESVYSANSGGVVPSSVKISGKDFVGLVGPRGVMFGSTPASSYTVDSTGLITAVPPTSVTSLTYSVTVNTFAGTSTFSTGGSGSLEVSASSGSNNDLNLTLPTGINNNSAYTVEAWVKVDMATNVVTPVGGLGLIYGRLSLSNVAGNLTDFWNQRRGINDIYGSYYLYNANALVTRCDGDGAKTPELTGKCPNITMVRGEWTHVVLQKSTPTGTSSRLTVFINGKVAATQTVTNNASIVMRHIRIGGFGDETANSKVSYGQIRVSSGAQYPTDGTSSFTPAYDFSNTVTAGSVLALFKPLSNSTLATLSDESGNGTTISSTVASTRINSSSAFARAGINGSIRLPSGVKAQIGRFGIGKYEAGSPSNTYRLDPQGGWTWEGWVNFESITAGYNSIFIGCDTGLMCREFPMTKLSWKGSDGAVSFNQCSDRSTGVIPVKNQWYHIAVSTAGNTGGATNNYLFIDGVQRANCNAVPSYAGTWEGFTISGTTGTIMKVGPVRLRSGQQYTANFTPLKTYPTVESNTWVLLNTRFTDSDSGCFVNADPINKFAPFYSIGGTATCSSDAPPIPPQTISYAAGGGSGSAPTSPTTVAGGSTFTTPTNTYNAPTGFSFAGWNDGTNLYAENTVYPSAGTVSTSVSLTAKWRATLSYVSGGGSGNAPTSPLAVLFGETFTVPANTYNLSGSTFAGWSNGIETYTAGATYPRTGTVASAVTLTATWLGESKTISYAAGGGLGSAPTTPLVTRVGETFTAPANTYNRTGYTFAGWSDGTETYTAGARYPRTGSVSSNVILTATWLGDTKTISYAAGGGSGSGPAVPTSIRVGETFTVPANPYTRTDYTFAGWSDGTETYTAGTRYPRTGTVTGDVILTARWLGDSKTISYAAGGGSGSAPTTPLSIRVGETFTAPANLYTRSGYTFAGWSDGTETYTAGTRYPRTGTVAGDVILTARWLGDSKTISYAAGGGSGSAPATPLTIRVGETFTAPANLYTRSGYTFAGWSDGTASYAAGATYPASGSVSGNVILTATWLGDTKTISYAAGGGSGSGPAVPTSIRVGETFTVPANPYTRTDYTFAGWSDGTNTYAEGATYPSTGSVSGNVVLTARWLGDSKSISYAAGGGSGSAPTTPLSIRVGETFTAPANPYTRTGYTFAGWSDGTETYTAGARYPRTGTVTGDVILTATWGLSVHTITYRHNNCYPGTFLSGSCLGDTPMTPISTQEMCTYGSSYTFLGSSANGQSAPTISSRGSTATSYIFNGWNTTNNGGGIRHLPGSTITCTEDLRIHVQWSNYSINFNTGFGGPAVASAPVDPNLYLTASAVPTASKPNWTFRGWTRAWGVGSSNAESIPAGAFRANLAELGSERNGPDVYISDYTLCAKWANAIEFNAQGATTTPAAFKCAQGYETGTAVSIPTAEPTKTNATFGGWYTGINGAGTKVTGNSFTPASPYGVQTLYAYWLGVKFDPTFGIPTRTANGFVVSTTNYDPNFIWDSATVTSGSGSVSALLVNNQVQLTVTGMSPGTLSTVSLKTSRAGYVDGTGFASGQALAAGLVPFISNIVANTGGFQASVTYNQDYQWNVSASSGSAAINTQGQINVTGVLPSTAVTLTVSTSRPGYATVSETATVTTLQLLRVYYNGNGATGGSVPSDDKQYRSSETATVLGNLGQTPISILGNTFIGWTLNQNGTGRVYIQNEILQLASLSVTLYAKWSLVEYVVSYNASTKTGGNVPVDNDLQGSPSRYTIGQSAPILLGTVVRTGYSFVGWRDNSGSGGSIYKSGETYTVGSNNVSFYAQWSTNTYTVTYDVNGASGSPSKASDTYTTAGTPITLAAVGSMEKTGYNFVGWGLSPVSAAVSDSYTVTSNLNLYAQWSIANYAITYAVGANGSGTPPTQVNLNYGSSFIVAAATGLSATDAQGSYAFVSWSDGTKTYAPGQNFVMGASAVTLTAQWTRIWNVKYSFNGGTVSSPIADQQKISGETITVTSTQPTRPGYQFINWIDQSGETTTAGSSYTVDDNHYLLYAQWSIINFTITYNADGGNTTPTEPSRTIGEIFTVAAAPSKTGYDFSHWSDGSAIRYNAGTSYQVGTSNVTLQAQWTAQKYLISYDFNGGTGTPLDPTEYTFGSSPATLPSSGITRTDFTFSGWATSTTATVGVSTFAPSGNITLNAVWVSSVYRLSFDATGGFSDSATVKVTIGQSFILPGATRANYTLQGWSPQQSGGSPVAAGASYTPAANGPLYAYWTLQVFTVTYFGNGGTAAQNSNSMAFGSTTPLVLPTASREHYVFKGWYSASTGGFLIGQAGANYSPAASINAYAQWIQLSLYGMGDATQIAQITVQANTDSSFTAGSNGSTATVSYLANSLPAGTVITAYVENSVSRVTSLITVASAPVLSLIIAWVAPDGTVPDTESGTAITMTVFNPSIKAGSKVFGLLGNQKDVLGTATVDGQVQVSITKDPAVVVAKVGPDAPTDVASTAVGETSAMISWAAPAVNGGSEITGYTATASSGQSCTTTTTSCLITGLTPGAALTFSVVASNAIGGGSVTTPSPTLTLLRTQVTANPVVVENPAAALAVLAAAAAAAAVAELKAAQEKVAAELKAADLKAAAEKAAAELKAATEFKAALEKAAAEKAAAEKLAVEKAAADAAIAAALAAKKITPEVSLYSISPKLTLSTYDLAYLKKYLSTLKKTATVTCIGYTYTQKSSLAKATVLAKQQANALCSIVKKSRPSLKTSILIRPATSAPKAAAGAKWVAMSYRVDGFEPKK